MYIIPFYIYENWRVRPRKALIHLGSGRYCKNGQGRNKGNYNRKNAKWHGPYSTLQKAQKAQAKMSVEDRRECQFCLPFCRP